MVKYFQFSFAYLYQYDPKFPYHKLLPFRAFLLGSTCSSGCPPGATPGCSRGREQGIGLCMSENKFCLRSRWTCPEYLYNGIVQSILEPDTFPASSISKVCQVPDPPSGNETCSPRNSTSLNFTVSCRAEFHFHSSLLKFKSTIVGILPYGIS